MLGKLTIRQQLIASVAIVHALLMTIFVVDLVVRQREFLHTEQLQRGTGLIQGMARQVTVGLLAGDLAAVQEVVDGLLEYPELHYAFVTDPSGRVMAHSDRKHIGAYLSDPLSLGMLRGAKQLGTLVDDERALDLAMPILSDGRLIGWVRFASGRSAAEMSLQGVAAKGALYALVAIVIGSVLAWWMGRAMTRRLYGLLKVADSVRAGERDVRAEADSVNEVGRVAAAFNAMLAVLTDRERSLQEANTVLEARVARRTEALAESEATLRSILEHANDAFIQMDSHGQVMGWNDMAQTTFGWSSAEAMGQSLAELIIPEAQREAHRRGLARYLAGSKVATLVDQRAEMTGCTKDGRELTVEVSLRARHRKEKTGADAVFFDAFVRDITERKRMEQTLEMQAATDALTGLPNRRSLLQNLPVAKKRADRSAHPLALIFLDLDGFKEVNDTYGHEAGDKVLAEFAQRLLASVRDVDTVVRLAGDEFVIIIEALCTTPDDAQKVAAKILAVAQIPFDLGDGNKAQLSASIGVSLYVPPEQTGSEELLARADQAMYDSKHHGKGRITMWRRDTEKSEG